MNRQRTQPTPIVVALAALLASAGAAAAPFDPKAVPPGLGDWIPWVLDDVPERACPAVDGAAVCVWPGVLELDLSAEGGDFGGSVWADRPTLYPLPGDAQHWPQEVRLGDRPAAVLDRDGLPHVALPAGESRFSGVLVWQEMPEGIRIPRETAIVAVRVDGAEVAAPRRDDDGLLWLQSAASGGAEGEALTLEVFRRISDGIPLLVETRIVLRASGGSREVDLGPALLGGTEIMSVAADVPARVDKDSRLRVQVRAGTHNVTLVARVKGPIESIPAEARPGPWPAEEIWVWQADEALRQVSLSGQPGIDPVRTSLPEEWTQLPAFQATPGSALRLSTTRRGEPTPPPDKLSLAREYWMDLDGEGFTVRDNLTGDLNRTWRLDLEAKGTVLGHVSIDGEDRLITRNGKTGAPGVELRNGALALTAEWRLDGKTAALPAVGWTEDVQQLGATLNLPPGWTLLTARGVDDLPGTWWDEWNLFGFFFVLLVSLAFAKLTRWYWGFAALAALVLLHMEAEIGVVVWISLSLLITLGLLKVLPRGGVLHVVIRVSWWVSVVILVLALVPFSVVQIRKGLYPQIDGSGTFTDFDGPGALGGFAMAKEAAPPPAAPAPPEEPQQQAAQAIEERAARMDEDTGKDKALIVDSLSLLSRSGAGQTEYGYAGKKMLPSRARWRQSLQQDPKAIVQTGPGVPAWQWRSWSMSWSGPVSKEHEIRLYLLGPTANLLLAVLRIALLVLLAVLLVREALAAVRGPRPEASAAPGTGAAAAAGAAAALLVSLCPATAGAQATPPQEMLDALRAKLTRPADCEPDCASSSRLDVQIQGDRLILTVEASLGAAGAFRLPGPAANWAPAAISVDYRPTSAVALLGDGFLHVRLPAGPHTISVAGPLPESGALTLELGEQPHFAEASTPGWEVSGIREDGRPDSSIQLSRIARREEAGRAPAAEESAYPPWLEVTRALDFGIPWLVHTTVRRVSPPGSPIVVRVPLLAGESVTESKLQVEGGAVVVSLGRDETEQSWSSALEEQPGIAMTAAADVPWSEVWIVRCSPIWRCESSGLAPVHHEAEGRLEPTYRPWPGEKLSVRLSRPEGVAGQSITVDSAALTVSPGTRLLSAVLELSVRSSRGGAIGVTLPDRASVQSLSVDGAARPYRMNGRKLEVTLLPGRQAIRLEWQQPGGISAKHVVPAVTLSEPAANAKVVVELPGDRWLLWAGGPPWGPAVLFWGYLLTILIASGVLGRLPFSPLRSWQWALLALGLTQVPPPVSLAVVGWFLALAWRKRRPPRHFFWHNGFQIVLGLWTLAALICLLAAVYFGLAVQPDMQVEGAGSYNTHLVWYADRTAGALPQPWVLSLPLLVWKIAMLVWSLWLAYSLVRWGQWAWRAYSHEQLWRSIPRAPRPSQAAPPPPAAPAAP